ncbi:MAG: HAD-IIB family hydrolase [Nocardioides sp.]
MSGPVPGLVATDLDGTLVRPDGSVSARTRTTLARLAERGVPVVLVTARPIRWMDDLWPLVGGTTVGIVSNGAVLYDVPARRVARVVGIDRDPGLAMLADLRAAVPEAAYAVECLAGLRADPRFDEPDHREPGTVVGDLDQLWNEPVVKVLVRAETVAQEELVARTVEAVGTAGIVSWTTPGLVEVAPPGVTKAAALAEGAPGWACPPVRWWRSATCPTTWRC